MQILFGLFVLAILIVGLVNRRKSKKTWIQEERFEESGHWIDKRSGERGTVGSLDREMEANRMSLSRQGRVVELALRIRTFAFEQFPGFHDLTDAHIRQFNEFARLQSALIIPSLELYLDGRPAQAPSTAFDPDEPTAGLKKVILDFAYENYPGLLDGELDDIRQLDQSAGLWASGLTEKILELKK
jgi:hypothetical protein